MKTEYIIEGGVVHVVYIYSDGTKVWTVKGRCHRLNGPAYTRANGTREWYIESRRIDMTLPNGEHNCEVFSSVEVKL